MFQLYDGKVGTSTGNILKTKILSGNKINVRSNNLTDPSNNSSGTDNKTLNVIVDHEATTRTDSSTASLTTEGSSDNFGSDTIANTKVKLFVLDGSATGGIIDGLKTDGYGHVTGLEGKIITFEHNHITNFSTSYSASSNKIGITLGDSVGYANKSVQLAYKSDTLQIKGYVDANNAANNALEIDLVWGTFN